jgi:hypothetical protein
MRLPFMIWLSVLLIVVSSVTCYSVKPEIEVVQRIWKLDDWRIAKRWVTKDDVLIEYVWLKWEVSTHYQIDYRYEKIIARDTIFYHRGMYLINRDKE